MFFRAMQFPCDKIFCHVDSFDQEPLHAISDTYSPPKSALEVEAERFERQQNLLKCQYLTVLKSL